MQVRSVQKQAFTTVCWAKGRRIHFFWGEWEGRRIEREMDCPETHFQFSTISRAMPLAGQIAPYIWNCVWKKSIWNFHGEVGAG